MLINWNVRGKMSSANPLSNLLDSEKIDVALITEHKLLPRSIPFLDTINSKYKSTCSFCSDVDYFTHVRCGKAGTAILYRKDISNKVTCIKNIENDRISGIEYVLKTVRQSLCFVYTCLPIAISKTPPLLYLTSKRYCLSTLQSEQFLAAISTASYGNESKAFTFTPTQTTVDHILFERITIPTFKSYRVIPSNDIVTSDHLPLIFQMNMASSNEPTTYPTANKNINWQKCNALHLHNFQQEVDTFVTSLSHKHSLDDLDPEILNSAIINCF